MTEIILQIVLGSLGLVTAIFAWWIKRDIDKKKAINDEDKKIDAVANADDTLIELDRLRHKQRANRP